MTDANLSTRLAAALDAAVAALASFQTDHPVATVDAPVATVDAVVEAVLSLPLETLGDVSLRAGALLTWYGDDYEPDADLVALLEVLAELPERLALEPLPPAAIK